MLTMQRRNLVILLSGILVIGCIVIVLVLTRKSEDTFEEKFIFNPKTNSYHNRLLSVGRDLDAIPSIDRKLFYELNRNCAQSEANKITGGEKTDLYAYTWITVLEYDVQSWGCGGSLISDRYILTAAHCITNPILGPPSSVIVGDYNLTSDKDCQELGFGEVECAPTPAISVDIERIDVHPNWINQEKPFYDDIALIRLANPVKFDDFLQRVCLPNESYVPDDNTTFVAAGWGITEYNVTSDVKLQVSLPLFSRENCSRRLKRDIKDGQICAGGVEGKDTCKGDSGGPLMVIIPGSSKWSIAGLVSMGASKCGLKKVPAVYTFIPKYLDWIFEKMKP